MDKLLKILAAACLVKFLLKPTEEKKSTATEKEWHPKIVNR